uniref:M23ase beta-sheet core domain-containing protein n=1 Tax=Chloropicon laureae TaxID=464258 RepID=A0A7S3E557_9CHLO|mmetsp:Transcript_8763/g.22448  ORF Transcript_8763/g.22448 Transcript_8763/m.22448 type:complete len:429 (+) Transcript_8763:187-1473(+)|eukprot:CAMPEP_0197499742 /NCGR_PEP_ID=MMETSP1311-20131121/61175_1 /TAXON_ID=464262 /ORGANISM="Genus nov. species nov., Strain RCC856" /LENGTH=428 /DNA_ID=CAMNT_0043045489 /DNA_START=141 /DNA_END=1427 /DNA_ORIENTATION=+
MVSFLGQRNKKGGSVADADEASTSAPPPAPARSRKGAGGVKGKRAARKAQQGAAADDAAKSKVPRLDDPRRAVRRALGGLARRVGVKAAAQVEPDVYVTSTLPVQGQTVAVFVSLPRPNTPLGWLQHALSRDGLVRVSFSGREYQSYRLRTVAAGASDKGDKGPSPSRGRELSLRGSGPGKTVGPHPQRSQGPALPRPATMYRTLIPTTPLDAPGVSRTLEIEVLDPRYKGVRIPCSIQKQQFETQHIWLSKQKSKLLTLDESTRQREERQVAAWQNMESPAQLWSGPFVAPSDGIITTQYGQQRYYNGTFAKNYYHRGIDYGAEKGSPVTSPAGGRVVLVGKETRGFNLRGNCVGLDHGQGVGSMLMHLDRVKVRVGSRVRKGQLLGTVGDTGVATGPHLHWGLFVKGQCVDPYMWMTYRKAHRRIF